MRTRDEIIEAIAGERLRQINSEGYTYAHDDIEHEHGQLAMSAACYADPYPIFHADIADSSLYVHAHSFEESSPFGGPYRNWRSKHSRVRQLEIAAALIVAELERLERAGKGAP